MDFTTVNMHLMISDFGIRSMIRGLLASLGFKDITIGKNLIELRQALQIDMPDLLVVGSEFPEDDVHQAVREARDHKIGFNPFMSILTIMTESSQDVVRKVVNSGVDDLLVFPLSRQMFEDKLEAQVLRRKSFVVTSHYIGPDRRPSSKAREGPQQMPSIEVPNSFRSRVEGTYSEAKLKAHIEYTLRIINQQRLQRYGLQIEWLISRIVAGYKWADGGTLEPEIITFIDGLIEVARDTALRIDCQELEQVYYMCETLLEIVERVREAKHKAAVTDIELLPELGQAFKMTLSQDRDAEISKQIRDTLRG